MTPVRKLLFFAATLALCLALVEAYARHAVRTTPARQTLARYLPPSPPGNPAGSRHAVFLGSSLTDAGVRAARLDSLLQERAPGFRVFNLALAGLGGSDNYYLLLKDFILPRRPDFLVVEAAGLPFFPSDRPFKLEGEGMRVESFRSELMSYSDFVYLSGGFPGPAASLSFWLHKHWFSYHYRLEIQARLRERLLPRDTAGLQGPYKMTRDAREMFADGARKNLLRLQAAPDVTQMIRGREARFLGLAALAKENGIRLAVLNPPCPPVDEALAGAPAAGAYNDAFARLCDSLGVVYLDLRGEKTCGPYAYADGIHLDAESAGRFTACLAGRLGHLIKD